MIPVRWLAWSPVALVPFLGAWWVGGPNLEQQLSDAAVAATKAGGFDWARVEISGRDARIAGESPDEAAITAAVQAVAGTYGIRRATSVATVAPPPPPPPPPPPEPEPLVPPTINSILTNNAQPEISGTWPEGTANTLTVTLAERSFNLGTDPELSSDGAGNWKLKPAAPMADGNYDISVEASDGATRKAGNDKPGTLTIDTVAPPEPSVTIATVQESPEKLMGTWPEGDAVSLKVGVAGTSHALGRDDRLASDGGGNWALTLANPLSEGRYDVSVEVADAAGNVRSKIVSGAIEIDRTAPAAPTMTPFTGVSSPERITGRWAEGDAVSLAVTVGSTTHRLGNSAQLASDGSGNWALAFPAPLAAGRYDVTVETADRAGNVSRVSSPGAIEIASLPASPTVDPVSGSNSAPLVSGGFDTGRTQRLTVKLGNKTYELGRDPALTSPNAGIWTLKPEPLADGVYDVVVEAADRFGNVVKDSSVDEVEVDTTPPRPATVDKHIGNSPTPRITGTWAEGDATRLSVTVGGKTYESGKSPALVSEPQGRWSLTPETPLADGYYDVVAISADRFGNESRDGSVAEVVVDTTPPAAPTVEKYAGSNPRPEIKGTWPAGDAKALSIRVGGKTYVLGTDAALSAGADGTWKLIPDALPDGYYDVVAMARDAAGNESRDITVAEVVIDMTAPAAPTVEKYAGNNPRHEIKGTWPAGDAKALSIRVGGKTYVLGTDAALSAGADGTWKLVPDALPDGYHDVVAMARDAYGNESRDTTVAEVVIDTAAPPAPTVNAGSSLPVTGTFAPGETRSLTATLAGNNYELGKAPELTAQEGTWSLAPKIELAPGTYDVVVTAADEFGNHAVDTTAGELVVPEPAPPPAPPEPPQPPPPQMTVPTIASQIVTVARPKLTGTWSEGVAQSLKVTVAGDQHILGKSDALTSDGAGRWSLVLDRPLRDGIYDIVVETTDAAGGIKTDNTRDELIVDAAPPATPTVRLSATELSPASISGTWAEGDAISLSVGIDGTTAALGTDRSLRSDGRGNWTLALSRTLDPGSYDVVVTTKDGRGRISSDQTRFEILIKGVEEAKPVPDTAPADCQSEFNTLLTVEGIRFGSDDALLHDSSLSTIAKLAAIAANCPDKTIEIAGHTDSTGSSEYNQALSERRAIAVRDAMLAAGVDRGRMVAKGYGEARPLADNTTEQGRKVNRRIEFTILN